MHGWTQSWLQQRDKPHSSKCLCIVSCARTAPAHAFGHDVLPEDSYSGAAKCGCPLSLKKAPGRKLLCQEVSLLRRAFVTSWYFSNQRFQSPASNANPDRTQVKHNKTGAHETQKWRINLHLPMFVFADRGSFLWKRPRTLNPAPYLNRKGSSIQHTHSGISQQC